MLLPHTGMMSPIRLTQAARKSLQLCLLGLASLQGAAQAGETGFDLTFNKAIELQEAGGFDAAIQVYLSLRADRPQDAHLLYELARSSQALGKLPDCVDYAAASLATDSIWQPAAFALKARCERDSGDADVALSTYRQAVERHPGDARLHFGYALELDATGDAAGAERQLRLALDNADQQPALFLEYGALLESRGDPAGELLMNLRYIMVAPHSPQAAGAAEQVHALLEGNATTHPDPAAVFDAAFRFARAVQESGQDISAAERLSQRLQGFVLQAVSTAGSPQTTSVLWDSAVMPLLSLAEYDVLDAYLYFVGALARTDGSPEWLSAHRQKFERLVEYLARPTPAS